MAAELSNGTSALISSHEDRLQKVEEGVKECAVAVAGCQGEIKRIGEKVDDGFAALGEKLDKYNGLHEKTAALGDRLHTLEVKAKVKAKRIGAVKGAGWGVLLTGLGAAAAKFGEDIVRAIFRAH